MILATQYLYDHVRQGKPRRPFCLTVSLTHPHDPYTIEQEHWDQYEDVEIPMPKVHIPQDEQDPHTVRVLKAVDLWDKPVPDEAIRRARRAYFGACSYVDKQIGKLLGLLKKCSLDDNTVVIFSGDHGDMLGERGMWYKMSWLEMSARVPLIINYPSRFAPRRVDEVVSTMDLLPTMLDLAGGRSGTALSIDGRSMYDCLLGEHRGQDEAFGEYMGEGTISPVMMIRRGKWKYITSPVDPLQLFDLSVDPFELLNLAKSTKPEYARVSAAFAKEANQKWDFERIHADVLMSQRQRRVCWSALTQGRFESWDYQPEHDARKMWVAREGHRT